MIKNRMGVFLALLAAISLAAGSFMATGCGGEAGLAQTVPCSEPSAFTFDSELISVNAGGSSLLELKELPEDSFWTMTYSDPRSQQAPEYHQAAFATDGIMVAVGSNTDMPVRPITGELMVGKYDRDGQALPGWPKFHTDPVYRWNEGHDVVLDAEGNMAIAGYSIVNGQQRVFSVWRLGPEGNILPGWPQYPASGQAYGTGVIVENGGDIIACGAAGVTGRDQIVLARFKPDGTTVEGWPKAYQPVTGQGTFSYDLIQDMDGNLVVVGFTQPGGADRDAVLYKLDAEGNVLDGWPKIWDFGPGSYDEYFAVSQDVNSDYCIVGTSQGTNEDTGKLLITRYSEDGEQLDGWPRVYDQDGIRDYSPPDAWRGSVDSSGAIAAAFICLTEPSQVRTMEYATDGSMMGGFPKTMSKEGYFVGTRSCVVDELDNIYTLGFSYQGNDEYADHTTFIVKYPPGKYSTGRPSAVIKQGICYTTLTGFSETAGPENEGRMTYQLSPDGEEWFFYNGTEWEDAGTKLDANDAEEINEHIAEYAEKVGPGTLYIKAFLVSDGSQKVQLESITVNYEG